MLSRIIAGISERVTMGKKGLSARSHHIERSPALAEPPDPGGPTRTAALRRISI
jgi:hypothetical protein